MWHFCCRQCWLLQLAGTGKLAWGVLEHGEPVLSKPWIAPSWVHQCQHQRCPTGDLSCVFQCSSLNFSSWEPPFWKENVYLIKSGKECLGHLQLESLKKGEGFGLAGFVPQKSGAQGRRGNSCPFQLCSSNLGTTSNCCARANATTWAWAWLHSVLANCWVFPI